MSEELKQKPLSFDEALQIISDIARNGEGADKFRAAKMIMGQADGAAVLPEPLTDAEVVERLGRMNRAAGPTLAQLGYRKGFPAAQRPLANSAPKVTLADLTLPDRSTWPVTLSQLYRAFPEIRRPGTPKGFNNKWGVQKTKEWCHEQFIRLMRDREQKIVDEATIREATSRAGKDGPTD